jgi:integrase
MSWKEDATYQMYKRALREDFDRAEGTIEAYEYAWLDFCNFLPSTASLDDVPAAVNAYREELRVHRRAKSTTLYQRLSAIHGYFKWLYQEGYVREDPMARMRMPKRTLSPHSVPTPEEVEKVLSRLKLLPRREKLIIALGAMAGLRRSEICNLNVEDIDFDNSRIRILNAKGHKDRDVVMHPELARILREECDPAIRAKRCPNCGYGPGPLIHGGYSTDGPVQRLRAELAYKSVRRHFPEYGPHDLRALFITVALEQGVPLQEVQKQAGHSSADTTVRYQGRRNTYAEAQLRQLDFTKAPPKPADDEGIVHLRGFGKGGKH